MSVDWCWSGAGLVLVLGCCWADLVLGWCWAGVNPNPKLNLNPNPKPNLNLNPKLTLKP